MNSLTFASRIKDVLPVKVFFSIIFSRGEIEKDIKSALEKKFNLLLTPSETLPFTHTDYYEEEMGKDLKRFFLFSETLFPLSLLPYLKHKSREIEILHSVNGKRKMNIDPGFITLEKICLLTYKNYYHRFHIGEGVYAEMTLAYMKGRMVHYSWTYPDYREEKIKSIFLLEREKYKKILKEEGFL